MTHHPLRLAGAVLLPDLSGALLWPEQATVVVADLHLEKGSAFARRGSLLPPYDTRATLDRLEAVLNRTSPRRVICLGDSVHDRDAADRMVPADTARIKALTAAYDWVWVSGNHDPQPAGSGDGSSWAASSWGGRVEAAVSIASLVFRHEAEPGATGEVSGHFHPVAVVRTHSRRVRARCFAGDGRRLILPAFGAYTGGLNVLDPAVAGLLRADFHVHLIGTETIHLFPRARLSRDAA